MLTPSEMSPVRRRERCTYSGIHSALQSLLNKTVYLSPAQALTLNVQKQPWQDLWSHESSSAPSVHKLFVAENAPAGKAGRLKIQGFIWVFRL